MGTHHLPVNVFLSFCFTLKMFCSNYNINYQCAFEIIMGLNIIEFGDKIKLD